MHGKHSNGYSNNNDDVFFTRRSKKREGAESYQDPLPLLSKRHMHRVKPRVSTISHLLHSPPKVPIEYGGTENGEEEETSQNADLRNAAASDDISVRGPFSLLTGRRRSSIIFLLIQGKDVSWVKNRQ